MRRALCLSAAIGSSKRDRAMFDSAWVTITLLTAAPLLFSLTVHEYAHARMALAFGDPTAKLNGRVTLNPLAHLDPIGTLALFLVHFGWAKPVPVNPMNLHPRRLGDIMVSLAGPLSNLLLAMVSGLLLRLWVFKGNPNHTYSEHISILLSWTLAVNLMLCLFNLIPLFPLDGHHILREFLPAGMRSDFMRWQVRYGQVGLLAMIFLPRVLNVTGPIQAMFRFVIEPFVRLLLHAAV